MMTKNYIITGMLSISTSELIFQGDFVDDKFAYLSMLGEFMGAGYFI